ncbi:MAG: FAD binding domain-containing protein [Anaerolineaceae bacterium]
MWKEYFIASEISEALQILSTKQAACRLVAGATDLVLELERGVRKGIETLVDISRIRGLDTIEEDEQGVIHIGALVTHNQCLGSKLLREKALPLVQACWQVGSPQIRNRGTIAGNLITASPANDTISPLMALNAEVCLRSTEGIRWVDLNSFYTGVRKTVMRPDEMLTEIRFPAMQSSDRGVFLKLALRNAQAISLLNATLVLHMAGERVESAAVILGAVAPTVIHSIEAENCLTGSSLTVETIAKAAEFASQTATPISDVRSSANYRKEMTHVLVRRGLEALANGDVLVQLPDEPVLLVTEKTPELSFDSGYYDSKPIQAVVNGQLRTFATGQHKTLAHLLRDEGQLTGTKVACGEGECGACTVWLDGKAVMSCLVPAPRAQGAEITTVEGLEKDGVLHPVQSAFIEYGAVQCGFCTPGFLMSAAKLFEEKPHPMHDDIVHAISGNLCRCTGYYKIIEAIEHAVSVSTTAAGVEH